MRHLALAIVLLLGWAQAAQGFGRLGAEFGHLGAGAGGGSFTPPVPCTSTGIFNLSNVCNDIYFIGALK